MQVPQSTWQRSIDVSDFDNDERPIAWGAVVPQLAGLGIDRVIVRAGFGADWTDTQFVHNWTSLQAVGFPKGAYFAANPDPTLSPETDAQHQAAVFLATVNRVGGIQGNDWVILDFERQQGLAPDALVAWARQWLGSVYVALGSGENVPIFYSYWAFIAETMGNPTALSRWPLWIAAYPGGAALPTSAPPPLAGWADYTGWQYSNQGQIPGIAGAVDLSVWALPRPAQPASDPTTAQLQAQLQAAQTEIQTAQAQIQTLQTKITNAQKALN